ncbi:MAG TPA: cyclopropane-fatty-acyl-phospholipid synthase family protein [Pirellulales bacterium]|jgi:cyclopropane-fatty-acyl-phospholipid synthase|nr:cyclopropane-fatty-acyl-phospholipid synthase family protein [Pirellulales bacterium]
MPRHGSSVEANAPAATTTGTSGWLERYSRRLLERQLSGLTGGTITIVVDGNARTFGSQTGSHDLQSVVTVHDSRFYSETVLGGCIGAAEAYMRGYWSCDDLTSLLRLLVVNSEVEERVQSYWAKLLKKPIQRVLHLLQRNTRRGSQENIAAHYDLGNDVFMLFLDETMMYSCALFANDDHSLREAQIAKNDRICKKLQLSANDHVLEIGTGWGGFAIHAAGHYGCRITTTTISEAQYQLATQRITDAGLAARVQVIQQDYRDLKGQYDKLVSIEMIEAVGHAFLDQYFAACSRLLKPDGQMLIQAITLQDQSHDEYLRGVDFIQRYIFPGGCLPSMSSMALSTKRASDLQLYHVEDWTPHYARTLHCWRDRFLGNADQMRALGRPEWFIRLWDFYFCYCQAAFLERQTQSVQLMFVKPRCRRRSLTPALIESVAEAVTC